ncbi:MAG: M20 metallopeptidase family protein [Candidatus Izemoplasmataceae bacterium]
MKSIQTYREELHKIPEIGLQEFKTHDYLINELKALGYHPETVFNTGVFLYLDYGQKDTIMFRSDIDGLKITEQNAIPFKSTHQGMMHACGHDGHMAMLLGFAHALKDIKHLNRNVLLVFQPAEEYPGGAKEIIKTGLLTKYNVKEVYGIHLFPNLEEGTINTKPGPLMGNITLFDVEVHGKSAHAAMKDEGIDALYAATLFYTKVKAQLSKELDHEPHVATFGQMSSGSAINIISNYTLLKGTIRSLSKATYDHIVRIIEQVKEDISLDTGAKIDVHLNFLYPAVNNDPILYEKAKNTLQGLPFHELKEPYLISEDFSYYQQVVPGIFFLLGTKNEAKGFTYLLHNDRFNFNPEVLSQGVDLYLKLIQSY